MASQRLALAPSYSWKSVRQKPAVKMLAAAVLGSTIMVGMMERKDAEFDRQFELAGVPAIKIDGPMAANLEFVVLDPSLHKPFLLGQTSEMIANALYAHYTGVLESGFGGLTQQTIDLGDPLYYGPTIRAQMEKLKTPIEVSGKVTNEDEIWQTFLTEVKEYTKDTPANGFSIEDPDAFMMDFARVANHDERAMKSLAEKYILHPGAQTRYDSIKRIFEGYLRFEIEQSNTRQQLLEEHAGMYKEPLMVGMIATCLSALVFFAGAIRRKIKEGLERIQLAKAMTPVIDMRKLGTIDAETSSSLHPPLAQTGGAPKKAIAPKPSPEPAKKPGSHDGRKEQARREHEQLELRARDVLTARVGTEVTEFMFRNLNGQLTGHTSLQDISEGDCSRLREVVARSSQLFKTNGFEDVEGIIKRLN